MKAFKFKLESVLNLRERAMSEARQAHAAAGRLLEIALAELSDAEADHKRLAEQLGGLQRSSFRPADRERLWNALNYQKALCVELEAKAGRARAELEQKRQALLAARRDHEALLRLQEKQRTEHAQAAELAERAMIDDIVNARHAAKIFEAAQLTTLNL